MSNNYQQFSIALRIKDVELVDAVIEFVDNIHEEDYETDDGEVVVATIPSCFDQEDKDYLVDSINQWGGVGDWRNHQDTELSVCAEESANLEAVTFILQKLLIADAIEGNYQGGVLITWANTCSKMRPDEFSGGACYVTKGEIHWQPDPISWIDTNNLAK